MIKFPSNHISTLHHNTLPLIPLTLPNNIISPCHLHPALLRVLRRPPRPLSRRLTSPKHSNIWERRFKRSTLLGHLTPTPTMLPWTQLYRDECSSFVQLNAQMRTKKQRDGSRTTSRVYSNLALVQYLARASARRQFPNPRPTTVVARNVNVYQRYI